MTYEQYLLLFYICLALSVISFLVAVFLFFKLRIINVIGDLSGSNAKKAIENIRQQNESSGNKAFNPSPVNKSRGKITDKITLSGKVQNTPSSSGISVGTEKIKVEINKTEETTVLTQDLTENETTVLSNDSTDNETTVLANDSFGNETTVLGNASFGDEPTVPDYRSGDGETTVLGVDSASTGELPLAYDGATVMQSGESRTLKSKIIIEEEITFVHSNEQIN